MLSSSEDLCLIFIKAAEAEGDGRASSSMPAWGVWSGSGPVPRLPTAHHRCHLPSHYHPRPSQSHSPEEALARVQPSWSLSSFCCCGSRPRAATQRSTRANPLSLPPGPPCFTVIWAKNPVPLPSHPIPPRFLRPSSVQAGNWEGAVVGAEHGGHTSDPPGTSPLVVQAAPE